ncbi:MAG TPA: phosphoribosyltransferase family protein [Dehalococcoidia bacterium]|nr:phosphoribosyltransferase family protein [Dehalococcoidia bacterium]
MTAGLRFRDRTDGGRRLAEALTQYREERPLVVGVLRGGAVIAAEVAGQLGAEMDVIGVRKIAGPAMRELALGAVAADGTRLLNDDIIAEMGIAPAYVEGEAELGQAAAHRQEQYLRGEHHMARVKDRTVIVVDDGAATGATMRTALRSLAKKGPAKLVAAIPVASGEALQAIVGEGAKVVCLAQPAALGSVGEYYEQFEPVTDSEAAEILRREYRRREAGRS